MAPAAKYVCKVKCFYRGHLWSPGETLAASSPDEKMPKHFVKEGAYKAQDKEDAKEPATFSAITARAAQAAGGKTADEFLK